MRRRQLGASVASLAIEGGMAALTGGFSKVAETATDTTGGAPGRRFDLSTFGNRRPIPEFTVEPLNFRGFTPSSLR